VRNLPPLADGTPLLAVMGDSHSALFAHAGWRPGQVKATFGTGSSIMSLGDAAAWSPGGLCLTIAWEDEHGPAHAFEGNIRSTGATLTWLANLLRSTPAAIAEQAAPSSDGVHLVPAFGGLAAPWWDDEAVGLISGLTFATRLPQIARAALESIAFQSADVLDAMQRDAGVRLSELRVDGGAAANDLLMQFQADLLGVPVLRPQVLETTALGAAYLAGLTVNLWKSRDEIAAQWKLERRFEPRMERSEAEAKLARWREAVSRSRNWAGS
jgi:glycerol kinase